MKIIVLFSLLSTVPSEYAGVVRMAFQRWAAYQAFEVREQADPDAVYVTFDAPEKHWKYVTSNTVGLAFSKAWGYNQNLIVIRPREWERDELMALLAHETAHILLNEILHQNRTTSVLFKALRPNATGMLDMQDVRRLADQYGAAKPIPQKLAAPNRP